MSTALFFPDSDDDADEALAICRRCPVKAECAACARAHEEPFGVWGGRTEADRATDRPDPAAPRRPGPPPVLEDARLVELVAGFDPCAPAAPQLLARLRVSVPAAYKYLHRALALGAVEHRGRHIYPRR